MKKSNVIKAAIRLLKKNALTAFCLLFLTVAPGAWAQLTDPSFELQGANGSSVTAPWTVVTTSLATWTPTNSFQNTGGKSLQLITTYQSSSPYNEVDSTNTISVPTGGYIHVSAYVNSTQNGTSGPRAYLGCKTGANIFLSASATPAANTWTKLTASFTNNFTGTSNYVATVNGKQGGSSGATTATVIEFDDVWIYADSNQAIDTTAPNAASSPVVGAPTSSSLPISWSAASDTGSPASGIGGYIVVRGTSDPTTAPNQNAFYSTNYNSTLGSGTIVYRGSGTSFTDIGLAASTTYHYRIYAYDLALNYSTAITAAGTTAASANTATKLVFTSSPVTTTAGVASGTITVQRQNSDSSANSTDTSILVTLSSTSSGTVTFTPSSLTIPNGSSTATFTYTDTQAGMPTVTAATAAGLTSATQTETITAAAASKLVFTSTAITTSAGTPSTSITIQRQDAYGNPNTNDASITVTNTSTSTGVVTFSPASPLTITNGFSSVSFTYTDTKAGKPTLTAKAGGLSSDTQKETITAGTATQLQVLMPGETNAPGASPGKGGTALTQRLNTPFAVIINAVDAYWNVDTNQTTSVNFTSSDGLATLPANGTINLVLGTATVSVSLGTLNASPTSTVSASDAASVLTANTGSGVIVVAPYQFRSVASGNWSNTNTWSLSSNDGVSWVTPATTVPNYDYVVITNAIVTNDVAAFAATISVKSNATLVCNVALNINSSLDVFGVVNNTVTNGITLASGATATFEAGGTYQHNQNGGAIPTATWNAASTCAITGWTTGTIFTNGLSQAFGNFTWNNPSQTTNVDLEGFLTTVNGNLEIDSTGAGGLYNDNQTGTGVLAIQGNLTINGGNYGGYGGSASVGGKKTYWLLGGNLTLAGGTFYNNTNSSASSSEIFFTNNVGWGSANATISQTGGSFIWDKIEMAIVSGKTVSLATDFTLLNPSANTNRAFTVAGTLDCGSHVLSNLNSGVASAGSESFVLADGGTLKIGSTNGIDSTGATGNIQGFSQGIIFSTAANYVYNGTSGQKMGAGLPATVSSLTIANTAAAVTNTQPLVVTNLTVASGAALDFNGFTNIVVSAPSLGGKLIMEVNRVGANAFTGSQLDLSSGTLAYGGTLNVIATGSTLAAGDSIPLFSAGSYSGNFTATNLPTLGSGLAWNTSALNTSGSIAVVSSSVAPPTILPVQTDGAGNLLISVSTVVGHNYILVATTNLNSPIIWTTNSTTGGTGGIITNSVYINPAKPTQFFRYQVQ